MTAKMKILEFICNNAGLNFKVNEIALALNIKLGTINSIVSNLYNINIIDKVGRGLYFFDGVESLEKIDMLYRQEINRQTNNRYNKKGGEQKKKRKNKFKREETNVIELSPLELGEKLFAYLYELRLRIKDYEEIKEDYDFIRNENLKLQERITQLTEQINGFNQRKKLF